MKGSAGFATAGNQRETEGARREQSRRALRMAFVSYGLPVVGRKSGGIERVAHELAHGLALRGHRVTVWSFDRKPDGAAYEVRPLPYEKFATSWLGRRLTMGYLGNFLALAPDYADADVIFAMGDSLLLPLLRRPVVRVMHGSALSEALSASSPWRFVMQSGVYVQELITAATQRGCVGVSENTRRSNPFVRRVIPNGVDLTTFAPRDEAKTREPSILFVGTMTGRKRGALLLDWFRDQVRPRFPDARLMMVSPEGPPAEGVSYHTGVSEAELASLYRRAWVYASPSRYEGFGLPYLEAMASGTPVVATPNPGSREVLDDGKYGVLASDEDFPGAVLDLLGDERQRERLAAKAEERAASYSLERTLDAYEELALGLTGKGSRAPEGAG